MTGRKYTVLITEKAFYRREVWAVSEERARERAVDAHVAASQHRRDATFVSVAERSTEIERREI